MRGVGWQRDDYLSMRCPHCPAPLTELCRGEAIRHFCDLVNPLSSIYTPAFTRILVRDDVVEPESELARLDRAYASAGTGHSAGGCGC